MGWYLSCKRRTNNGSNNVAPNIQKTVKVCRDTTGSIVEYYVDIEKPYRRVTGIEFLNLDTQFINHFVNSIRIK